MSILKQSWTLVLYEQEFNLNDTISVTEDDYHYLTHVLRLKINDSIELSNGIGSKAFGKILGFRKNKCDILITHVTCVEHSKTNVHLMLAHLKPTALEESVFVASELGVSAIHLFRSERSISKQTIKIEKLQKISNEAIRISKSAYSAKVFQHTDMVTCIFNLQKNLNKVCFLFCDEESKTSLINFREYRKFENICVIVGPEASFSLKERAEILKLQNCYAVSLGDHILRAPTAITCACFVVLCNASGLK